MSTDRELLELAARAAGMQGWKYTGASGMAKMIDPSKPSSTGSVGPNWNPLTDDGDALRLAVKLNIGIHPDPEVAEVGTSFMVGRCGYNTVEEWGPLRDGSQDDPGAATRRAIVRAAAEIGKNATPENS